MSADGASVSRPPSAPPLVFVADLDHPELDPDDLHHLRRVLRVRDGDDLTIADGNGSWRPARFAALPDPIGAAIFIEPEPTPPITIAFAVVKGERPELIVQKLTELGADHIVPFVAARSVVRWDVDKAERNVARLRRVSREAAMQCRRARLPVVEPVASFADVVARPGAALADRDGDRPTLACPFLVIGAEGGWTNEERAAAVTRIGLSPYVLRAETAAITACVLVTALRAGLVADATG